MSSLITYHFSNSNEIRVIDNQWFIASDVCKGLEISDAAQAVRAIEKQLLEAGIKEAFSKRIPVQTNGGMQNVVCVNEIGLNLLIMQSRKKEAVFFKWWIASEVLPSIRKTGSYSSVAHAAHTSPLITQEQAQQIQLAVEQRSQRTGESYQRIYAGLHAYLEIDSYKSMPVKHLTAALKYLQSIPDAPELFKPATNNQTLLNQDGRWLVIVKNATVEYVKNIDGYNCVDADVFRKLLRQTKQQAEYLIELAKRIRVIHGECSLSRLDVPIEELHPKVII